MSSLDLLSGLLACPACEAPLVGKSCLTCRIDFADLAGFPWLFPDPRAALSDWRGRLHHLLSHYRHEAQRHREAQARTTSGSTAWQRLEHMQLALEDQALRMAELLKPLGVAGRQEALPVQQALGQPLALSQGLSSYYANIHRDWYWGEVENAAALAIVTGSLPEGTRPERMLVLGAGAGRLAYDLHRSLEPALSVGLDFNPLLLLLAMRASQGRETELYEFPIAPKSASTAAVLRKLAAPAAVENLVWVGGDAHAPPFLPGSFDLVVTPWFVDVSGVAAQRVMARVNRLLKPGGLWVNHGSLVFNNLPLEQCPDREELLQALPSAGFEQVSKREDEIPYLASPASCHARQESVLTFCARKVADVPVMAAPALPDWLLNDQLPVPLLPEIRNQALVTRVHAFLLAMINGERSLREMAALMEEQRLMPAEDARIAMQGFLRRLLEQKDERAL